ncbi:MAG: M4 family metallopeptidase [Saprospiraceae bacterium]
MKNIGTSAHWPIGTTSVFVNNKYFRSQDYQFKTAYFLRYLIIIHLLLNFQNKIFGQEIEIENSSCHNYNSFLRSANFDSIKSIATETLPNGSVYLNPNNANSTEITLHQMASESTTSFEFVSESQSYLNETKYIKKFQQYYNNIKVEGGGYLAFFYGPGGTNTPHNPCAGAYLIVPHILSNIEINSGTNIIPNNFTQIFPNSSIIHTELIITHNLLNTCEYNLVWKVEYINVEAYISWVDANTGQILKTSNNRLEINAPTLNYGTQDLINKKVGNTAYLKSPNNQLNVYTSEYCPYYHYQSSMWYSDLIPKTTKSSWTTEADPSVYQAFWVGTQVIPVFEQLFEKLDQKFDKFNLYVCNNDDQTYSLFDAPFDQAFASFGTLNGKSTTLIDVISHELTHSYLQKYLDFNNVGKNRTLHEGISDVIGTYIESQIPINNGVDWVIGDDELAVANKLDRNLQYPIYNCAQNSNYDGDEHVRGLVIGYWYYNVVMGNTAKGIPSLGLKRPVEILLASLPLLEKPDGLAELAQATLTTILDEYGRCSDEFLAAARAWELVCVPTGYKNDLTHVVESCKYSIDGPNVICEENNFAYFCANEGFSNYNYRFRIIGSKSTEFQSVCGMTGNTQFNCKCLTLTHFPKYPYYPQYLTLELYALQASPEYIQTKKIKLVDCNGDDPTCEEYYNLFSQEAQNRSNIVNNQNPLITKSVNEIRIFDVMGRLIYEGTGMNFDMKKLNYSGIAICQYFSATKELIKTKKIFIFH